MPRRGYTGKDYVTDGFDVSRLGKLPPPGQHPRLYIVPDDWRKSVTAGGMFIAKTTFSRGNPSIQMDVSNSWRIIENASHRKDRRIMHLFGEDEPPVLIHC